MQGRGAGWKVLLPALLFLGGACAATRPGREETRPAGEACPEVEGLDPLLVPGAVLLLGEMHGTAESPAFAEAAACRALKGGRRVIVALEIPREEQERVETFLASPGEEADRTALLEGPFWRSEYQDGRRSRAMLSLLDGLRRLSRQGLPLRARLIDREESPSSPQVRDRWMGEALAAAADESPDALVIALTGNVHSRITRGTPWDPGYEPMGFDLVGSRPSLRVASLNVSYRGGTAWFCTSDQPGSCGVHPLKSAGEAGADGRWHVALYPEVRSGSSGVYEVGTLTASPPARRPEDEGNSRTPLRPPASPVPGRPPGIP